FVLDVGTFLDHQTTDLLAFRAGLVRDELHAENGVGVAAHFVERLGELDATALAAATGVDLCLDDPDLATELLGGLDGFIDGETRNAFRRDDTELPQNFFCLVLMNFHGCPSIEVAASAGPRTVDGTIQIFECLADGVCLVPTPSNGFA